MANDIDDAVVVGMVSVKTRKYPLFWPPIGHAVNDPNIEPWFHVTRQHQNDVITRDGISYHTLNFGCWPAYPTKQFTAAERPIIKAAIERYVKEL